MECIDFDRQFKLYLKQWLALHAEEYEDKMDEVESMLPDIYEEFIAKPADWLNGTAPSRYFEKYEDAGMLVDWLREYSRSRITVPDLLLDRIASLGQTAEAPLLELFDDPSASSELQMLSVSLLKELDSTAPMEKYIRYIASLKGPDDKGDLCAESLQYMGIAVVEPILAALPGAEAAGSDIFADILSNYPGDSRIFDLLIAKFKASADRKALFASYLSKFGDPKAVPVLEQAARNTDTNYLDFVEISSAIEALGGQKPDEREFAGDPYYEALKEVND